MKKSILLLLAFVASSIALHSQDGLPTNPTESKCYVKCVTPDEYGDSTVRVMVKPAYTTLTVVPAVYKTVTETVVVQEASKRYEYVPAVYRTVYDTIVVEEGYNKLAIQKASFNNSAETVQTAPKVARWEMGPPAPDCASPNPMDCRVVCWKEYPAKFNNVPIEVLGNDASTTSARARTYIRPRPVR